MGAASEIGESRNSVGINSLIQTKLLTMLLEIKIRINSRP